VCNRRSAEMQHLVGPLSSVLSLRTNLSGNPTVFELLSCVQNRFEQSQAHFLPFEQLLENLELEPSLSHAPVFQVSFSFRETNDVSDAPGLKLEEFDFDDELARLDLALEVLKAPTRVQCRFRYSTDLFDRATI